MLLTHTARSDGRLSDILRRELGVSLGLMNSLKWSGGLRVNGEIARTSTPVHVGDTVTALLDEPPCEYPAEDVKLAVRYEDEYALVVDKPAGMLIHPSSARNTGTLANAVMGYYARAGIPGAFHPLTRLDRDTFGLVLIAKNRYACALLQRGNIQKNYRALCCGVPPAKEGAIEAPIARRGYPSLLREIRADGKPSCTRYSVLVQKDGLSLLSLTPVTGRTHQLRVHCAYAGFPIVGDEQYGTAEAIEAARRRGIRGQQLCAYTLTFRHPLTGEEIRVQSTQEITL